MKKFKIEVQETLCKVVEVEEETISDAIIKIKEQYYKTEIVLNYKDFIGVEFINIDSQNKDDEKRQLIEDIVK